MTRVRKATQAGGGLNLLVWIPGLALTLFCATGLAKHLGWLSTPIGHGDPPAPTQLRAALQESVGLAMRMPQAVSIGLLPLPCTDCLVIESAEYIGRPASRAEGPELWLGQKRATATFAREGDSLAVLIAWHACARSGGRCQ